MSTSHEIFFFLKDKTASPSSTSSSSSSSSSSCLWSNIYVAVEFAPWETRMLCSMNKWVSRRVNIPAALVAALTGQPLKRRRSPGGRRLHRLQVRVDGFKRENILTFNWRVIVVLTCEYRISFSLALKITAFKWRGKWLIYWTAFKGQRSHFDWLATLPGRKKVQTLFTLILQSEMIATQSMTAV